MASRGAEPMPFLRVIAFLGDHGGTMGNKKLVEEYLAKAKEAEALAASIPDTDTFPKESWLNIARGYRELAQIEQSGAPSP